MLRKRSFLFAILLGLVFGFWEAAWRTFFSGSLSLFSPTIPVIALMMLLGWRNQAMVLAGLSGMIQDVFAIHLYFFSAAYLFVAMMLWYLAENVMTNRTMYGAVVLAVLGRGSVLVLMFVFYGVALAFAWDTGFLFDWSRVWRILVLDIVFSSVLFFVVVRTLRFFIGPSFSLMRYVS